MPELDPRKSSLHTRPGAIADILDDLPEDVRRAFLRPVVAEGVVEPLAVIEKEYLLAVLALNGGNQTRTAEQLGIGSATLYRKLKQDEGG